MSMETDRVYQVIEIDPETEAAWVQEIGVEGSPDIETLDAKLWPVPITTLLDTDYYIPVEVEGPT